MGLCIQLDVGIVDNHHIRQMSKLDNSFVSCYCIGCTKRIPQPPQEPPAAPAEQQYEMTNLITWIQV